MKLIYTFIFACFIFLFLYNLEQRREGLDQNIDCYQFLAGFNPAAFLDGTTWGPTARDRAAAIKVCNVLNKWTPDMTSTELSNYQEECKNTLRNVRNMTSEEHQVFIPSLKNSSQCSLYEQMCKLPQGVLQKRYNSKKNLKEIKF